MLATSPVETVGVDELLVGDVPVEGFHSGRQLSVMAFITHFTLFLSLSFFLSCTVLELSEGAAFQKAAYFADSGHPSNDTSSLSAESLQLSCPAPRWIDQAIN